MARIMVVRGAQVASPLLPFSSQVLVRSLCNFVTGSHSRYEHFPSASGPFCLPRCASLKPPPISNFWRKSTYEEYFPCTRQLLRSSLLRSSQGNFCSYGSVRRVARMSGVAADDAPAVDVTPEDVLQFWFKDADVAKNEFPNKLWFSGGEAVDKEIKKKFGACLELACRGELDHWKSTPRGRVALVLVLDQFSRNCFRDSSRSFAQDDAALKLTLDAVEQGSDQQLSNPLERYFLYMPLMHSESLEVHATAQRLFQSLADAHKDKPELQQLFLGVIKFERAHFAVLTKFGKYPSRNALLGRKNTPEEEAYLAAGVIWPMED